MQNTQLRQWTTATTMKTHVRTSKRHEHLPFDHRNYKSWKSVPEQELGPQHIYGTSPKESLFWLANLRMIRPTAGHADSEAEPR